MSEKVTLFVNPEQVERILLLCWKATRIAQKMGLSLRVPVALVGDTGCGKTESVRNFYKNLAHKLKKQKVDLNLYTMILSMVPPEDIGGIPTVSEKSDKIKHKVLDCLPFDSDEFCIIFQDELDRATPETQNAALQFMLGGTYHGHFLSPNAYTISALNGTSDIYTNPLSQAARTRVCSIFISRSADGGVKSYDNWARKAGIPQVCRTFNTQFGHLIQSTMEFEELAVCCTRTLDMCGLVTKAKQEVDASDQFETDDIYPAIIAGLIGIKAMPNYLSIEKALREGLDAEEVINNPEEADLLEDPSMIFYLIQAVTGLLKDKYESDKKKVRAAATYGRRHDNDEWVEIWMTSLLKEFDFFAEDPVYTRWVKTKKQKGLGVM